ncbi:MAG: TolC family protein, partial [Tannerella sp.]|nr:TolC family protein [Tannerella sp.]
MKQWLVILSVWLAAGSVPLWGQERLDSLSTYLEAAEQGNPGLRSAYILYKAARQEIPQAGGLQDPKLDLGIFTPPMALVGGKEAAQFQLMQMFPWPGVLGARRSAAAHRAKAAYEQYRQARDLLRAEVQAQWFALCRLHQEEKYNREDTFLLSELETLALRRYEAPEEGSGMSQGSMADVLRIR